ncbi:hypothetical protein F5X99DRAFT_94947 [Biscogniauxia marginata]|nr:hypothetical protein F5X99DRAFT_94947 [Biscogniauxia marginata]
MDDHIISTMASADERPNQWNLGLPFKNCSGPHCIVGTNLQRCGACLVVLYCGVEHQKADRPRHKSSCNLIKQSREKLSREERDLRAAQPDIGLPENVFENGRGRFWGVLCTRPYMRARHELITAFLNIRTGEAAQTALDHCLETLDLCRGDNLGIRSQVPALYLRLGRDQEAYDFMKWYSVGPTSTYDWGDMSLPFLNLRAEDAFEHFEHRAGGFFEVSFLTAMICLKIQLLLDIKMLDRCIKKHGNQAYEKKMEWVREDAMSDILYKRPDIVEKSDYAGIIADLEDQVTKLCANIKKRNKHYLPGLHHPERYSHALPAAYTMGSPEEVNLAFRETWYMWSECAPALEVIKRYG